MSGSVTVQAPPPVIVLVRPQLGENIGKAARAMLNFGLTQMRLVAPRDGWPNPSAGPAASGADIVLANATVHETLAEAVADCSQVFATTVRRRDLVMPVVDPAEAATIIHGEAGLSALVFGPERSGLDSDDVALARMILTVPINPEFGSLNLAQAVIIAAYEWSKGVELAQPPLADLDPPAPQTDLEGLIGATNEMLEKIDYFQPESRKVTTLRNIRTLLTKPRWTAKEVQMMRGILRGIERGPR
ncbi:RNA methyltransferase [Sphingomonas lacunae]|uniref:tRNA (cytidine/uridine-2'-O-)-methyltransferase TrmJ n=1 Tax=Sphingomonas lacunae TaxID=2698828 RepID=A0A6M4AWK5_9SPHN|nr:RNA methyltransferase [Sphingomonas lacunae]